MFRINCDSFPEIETYRKGLNTKQTESKNYLLMSMEDLYAYFDSVPDNIEEIEDIIENNHTMYEIVHKKQRKKSE